MTRGKDYNIFICILPTATLDMFYLGQLPQPYDVTDLRESTRLTRSTFNDQNKQELNRFVQDPTKECNYIVDQQVNVDDQTELEMDFGVSKPNAWKEELSIEFLDAKRSPQLLRAFYIPFYSRSRCNFNKYTLYKNVDQGLMKQTFNKLKFKRRYQENSRRPSSES